MKYIFLIISLLFITGCSVNTALEDNSTSQETVLEEIVQLIPEVYLIKNTQIIETNEQVLQVTINIFEKESNNHFETGQVKIEYPDEIKTYGEDLGYFSENIVDVVSGKAVFTYTAPNDLSAVNGKTFNFNFYHMDNPTQKVTLSLTYTPKANQIIDTSYDLDFVSSDKLVTMPIETTKIFSVNLKDEEGSIVEDDYIYDINISSLNSNIVDFIKNTDGSNTTALNDKNNSVSVIVNSKTLSGLAPIEVSVDFKDVNGNDQNVKQVFNIVVLSGPPTTISFSYIETQNDKERAKFIEKWAVRVSDKYLNPINTNPAISTGAIVGYSNNGSSNNNNTDYLYYATSDIQAGTISSDDTFTAGSEVFANIDQANDVFVTFGNGYTYNASGKWDFTFSSDDSLILLDDFEGSDLSSMGFAMGNNHRQDQCRDSVEWTGRVTSSDGNYTVDDTGAALLDVEYDYYLTGKDIVLWTNIVGDNKATDQTVRIGEAQRITLRGLGIEDVGSSFGCMFEGQVTYLLSIEDTVEPYRNSNFMPTINTDGDVIATYSSSSMDAPAEGIYDCTVNNGQAYITLDINASVGECKGGSVTVSSKVINEF
ncbi:MAG: hypothetical protein U9Q33_07450 [Campylobacterota bacterium]|nr:hypothetical protein [Campylobacterota bacterium]